jgi:hypothetical protein
MSLRLVAELHAERAEASRFDEAIWKNLIHWRANNCARAIICSQRYHHHKVARVLRDERHRIASPCFGSGRTRAGSTPPSQPT